MAPGRLSTTASPAAASAPPDRHGGAARVRHSAADAHAHAHRSAAHARHRLVHGDDRLADRRHGDHCSTIRRPSTPRQLWEVVERDQADRDHHRRRLRSPSRCCARLEEAERAVRSVVGRHDRLVGRDVEPRRPSRGCSTHNPNHDADRRLQLVGSRRHGPCRSPPRTARLRPAKFQLDRQDPPVRREPAARSTPSPASRAWSASAAAAGRLLQGSGEERAHLRRPPSTAASRCRATGRWSTTTASR